MVPGLSCRSAILCGGRGHRMGSVSAGPRPSGLRPVRRLPRAVRERLERLRDAYQLVSMLDARRNEELSSSAMPWARASPASQVRGPGLAPVEH